MKKILYTIILFSILSILLFSQQSGDILYFAQSANGKTETGLSDRFTTGDLSVICKLVKPLINKHVFIQLDRYNFKTYQFEYYQSYEFWINLNEKYLYFNNVTFNDFGFYRVFLLDENNSTITSGLVEIISAYKQNK